MTELTTFFPFADTHAHTAAAAAAAAQESCEECVGTGGWYRYEPAVEAPGLLYLSCLQCRGSGRLAFPKG